MSEVADVPRFACEGCGKRYKWKPELSHKRVKCPCGATMTVPDLAPKPAEEADAPPALPDDDIFALIDNAPALAPPKAAQAIAAMSAAPVAQPAAKGKGPVAAPARSNRPGAPLGYQGRPTPARPSRDGFETFYDLKRDVYLPTGLIAGSTLAYIAYLMLAGKATGGASLAFFGVMMFVVLALKTVLMIAGAFVVAPMAGVSFGPFWTAILKLAAVVVTTDVAVSIVDGMIGMGGAIIVANAVGLAIYWGLIALLFDLDASEAWWVVVLFGLLRWVLTFVLAMLLLNAAMGGAGSGMLNGGGGASNATAEQVRYDEHIDEMAESGLAEEGRTYIKRTGRQSGQSDFIDKLYAAGAKNVYFTLAKDINGKSEPLDLVVEWPRDAKQRAAVLAAINAEAIAQAAAAEKAHPDWGKQTPDLIADEGGKYVELDVLH